MTVAERLDAEARRRDDTTLQSALLSEGRRITAEELDEMRERLRTSFAIYAAARERAEIAGRTRVCTI